MRTLAVTEFISYIFACLFGVIFHFVYDWSGNNSLIGLFFPVNESVWEHLKLVFFPIMIVSLIEYYAFTQKNSKASLYNNYFICIKLKSTIIGMLSTIILFYTINGMFGKTPDYVNIIIYFVAMAIAYLYSYTNIKSGLLQSNSESCMTHTFEPFSVLRSPAKCLICFFIITLMFMIFTVYPPNIPLFFSP